MWILLVIATMALSYLLLIRPHKYWLKRGVKQGKPVFILGDFWGLFLRKQSAAEAIQMGYNLAPNSRYCGVYQFLLPSLLLRDPDLIKQITVRDFDHFMDHRPFVSVDADPIFGNNLFSLTGKKWKDMRSILSPAFTSSKIKYMFSLILQNGEQFVNHFLKQDKDLLTVEMQDIFTRFTNDVIASVAFGVECDSFEEPRNKFYLMGQEATDFGIWKSLKLFGYILVPPICKALKLTVISKEFYTFFVKIISDNVSSREKQGIVRPDMVNLLMEARKNRLKYDESANTVDTGFSTAQGSEIFKNHTAEKREITDVDITAQAVVFFTAGFGTAASLMNFMSYELAINPDVQERLREEVDETFEECKGKLTYEALMSMKYMDMVVCETLRMWPPVPITDRVCTKPYTIESKLPEETPVHLRENDVVLLPIYALHRDPQYFPDPDRFDPERFSGQNKGTIKACSYMPFGSGPRNCIGSRVALLETKTLYFYLLQHFEIVPVEKTQIPVRLSKKMFSMEAEGGSWLGLKRRVK